MPESSNPESRAEPGADFGIFSRNADGRGITTSDIVAGTVSLIWLALVGGFFLVAGSGEGANGALGTIMMLVAIFVPIALIWIAAITVRTARDVRSESARLQAAVDAMRQAYVSQAQAGLSRSSVEKRLEEIAAAARKTESAFATFASQRDAGGTPADSKAALAPQRHVEGAEVQPALALGTGDDRPAPPISVADFIRAMNFPDNANDKEGFRALRRALDDHSLARLIRAAQDALTLLSQDGIYMDDLRPDRARPEVWRQFAQGERGKSISSLGGIRDRSSLALASARMRQDTIFRDTAHHFLRQFDKTVSEFEKNATDQEIVALSETRTARAFMLLGRVTGIFD